MNDLLVNSIIVAILTAYSLITSGVGLFLVLFKFPDRVAFVLLLSGIFCYVIVALLIKGLT